MTILLALFTAAICYGLGVSSGIALCMLAERRQHKADAAGLPRDQLREHP